MTVGDHVPKSLDRPTLLLHFVVRNPFMDLT
jgi:hypothetical protein